MAHAYTPGLSVTARTVVRKTRRLPLSGDVVASTGDHVYPGSVVAETHLPGNVHNVNVANLLGIATGDLDECMLVKIGDRVDEDTVLAESKGLFGWFKSVAKSPTGGTLEMVSDVTGQVLVREPPIPVQVKAYIEGEVVEVLPGEGVVVETVGTFIQGIFGIGGEVHAPVMMIKDSASLELSETDIDERCAGKIVCGGALASLDVLEKLRSFGAAGIVVGGVRYHDVGELLGYQLGVAITGGEDIGLTIIATEGFGRMNMADRTFRLLQSHEGTNASISGATQIRAGVIRPEIIIPGRESDTDNVMDPSVEEGLIVGSPVRIIRDPYFGRLGTVSILPEQPRTLESESTVRVLSVKLEEGEVSVPRANVEMVEE